jgi:two-component system, cell cycle sensor histidine kinase and response regulator CckA
MGAGVSFANRDEHIRLLEQELADTNREVLALTLELDRRLEELHAAEKRYRRLVMNAPDVILHYELHPTRICTFVNPALTTLTGYLSDEFYRNPDLGFQIVHPEERPLLDGIFRGEGPDAGMTTLRWTHKDGSTVWIEQHHVRVRDGLGKVAAIECIARDITARKRLEEQLLQAQKMEAIGRLAGGVAHDFNNLLTVINGYSANVLENLPAQDPLFQELEEICKAGERAAALTRQLLAFSRRQVLTPRVLDLNIVVAEMDRMLRRLLGEDIHLVTTLDRSLASVYADPGQMEQVIMNLAVNARDAMPRGGRLLIETTNVELDSAYEQQRSGVVPGSYVMLAVSDNGCGMDQNTQARIFEPFFTTKPPGQGTGLGLSTVFGIVQQSGGHIWVYSELGQGTTFKVYMPVSRAKPQPEKTRIAAKPATGSETILVVEDEDGVRNLIRTVLKRAGYQVMDARHGEEALQLAESHAGSIDLVMTDVVMPQISGRELATRLSALHPESRLLFMSGYTDSSVVQQHGFLDPQTPFLQKPFTPAVLTGKVREILDQDLI